VLQSRVDQLTQGLHECLGAPLDGEAMGYQVGSLLLVAHMVSMTKVGNLVMCECSRSEPVGIMVIHGGVC